ncbi:MAG TPA: hypothetical protein P5338_10220, partial [Bacteroidales bacterium]|nr:hypothetical protein [Bacteroidales bacterium]
VMVSEKFLEASKEKILGNFETSRKLLEECLKLDPEHHPSCYQLADIGHITGNYNSALVWAEKAVKLDPGNGWYKVLQADLLMKLERYAEAVVVFKELNRIWPRKRIWYEGLAKAQLLAGKPLESVKTYDRILSEFGFDEEIFFKMTGLLEMSGKQSKVEEKLRQLVRENPYNTDYLRNLAAMYVRYGKEDKAMPLWREILRIDPGNGEVHFEMAGYFRRKGDDAQAYQELLQAFSTPNLSIDAKIVVLLSYYNLTEQFPALLPQAYSLLDLTVKHHPDNPKGWSMYADFLVREQRYREALDLFKKVTELDSTRYLVWEQLLMCANALNDFTVLSEEGIRGTEQFPDQAMLYLYYGKGLLYKGRIDEARKTLSRGYLFTGFNDTLSQRFLQAMANAALYALDFSKGDEYFSKGMGKGNVTSWFLCDYMRFMVLSGRKEKMQAVMDRAASQPETDPWKQLLLLWHQAGSGNTTAVKGGIETLMNTFGHLFYVMESAGHLCQMAGLTEMAEACRRKALAASNGAKLPEKP